MSAAEVAAPPSEHAPRPALRLVLGSVAALLALVCLLHFGLAAGLFAAALVAVLAVLTVTDLEQRRIPNRIVLPAAVLALAAHAALQPERALEWTLAALGAALFLFLPLLVYPAGMGMGDVKLALLLGAALGTSVVLALLVASVGAALVGIALIALRGASARKYALPFGPFLAVGAVAALLLGDALG